MVKMKKIVILGLMLGLASVVFAIDFSLEARTDISYTSYMENSAYAALTTSADITALNAFEKIRLKASAEMDAVKFSFDGKIYLKPNNPVLEYGIDSAYFSFENDAFVLYAGKQRLKWGTGYFWNPSDSLQPPKNVFRTTENLEGVLALRADFSNEIITPSIILIPQPEYGFETLASSFKTAVQFYKLVGTMDLYLNFMNSNYGSSTGAALSWDTGFLVLNAEACRTTDPEHMWDVTYEPEKVIDFVVGASKTAGDFFINIEYFRKNTGFTNSAYASWVNFSGSGAGMIKQNYLAYSANYTWEQKLSFGFTGMHGLDDGTSYIFPSISWAENQNFDAQISLMQNLTQAGMKEGNYSTPFYSTVQLRLNAYF